MSFFILIGGGGGSSGPSTNCGLDVGVASGAQSVAVTPSTQAVTLPEGISVSVTPQGPSVTLGANITVEVD